MAIFCELIDYLVLKDLNALHTPILYGWILVLQIASLTIKMMSRIF